MEHGWLKGIVPVDLDKATAAMKLDGKFSKEDVHRAYKRRVVETQCHPDCPGGGDEGLFKRLTAARDLLLKSFEPRKQSRTFGASRKQSPMGAPKLIDEVLAILRSASDLDEAIERVEALR